MTKEEILALEAGRELDALVVQKVIGATPVTIFRPPPYSADISAAWQVIEHLFNDGWREQSLVRDHRTGIWAVEFGIGGSAFAESMNLPEAICKAALLTKLEV